LGEYEETFSPTQYYLEEKLNLKMNIKYSSVNTYSDTFDWIWKSNKNKVILNKHVSIITY